MGREHCLAILRGATHIQCAKRTLGLLLREGDRARLRARSAGVFPVLLAVGVLSIVTLGLDTRPGRFPYDSPHKQNCPAILGL